MPSPTVTFPCPFCGRRMGVPAELLGKQVRCPNCKQVVLAPVNTGPSGVVPALSPPPPPPPQPAPPAPAPAAPPIQTEAELPTFAPPRREAADSVFSDPEESEDEVFSQPGGRVPAVPPLDLTAPHASANPRPPARSDNPFEMSAPTAASQSLPQRPDRPAPPAPTSELPNPFLELEPVTLPAVFANPSGSKPAAPAAQPSAATQPFPAPAPFPLPAPAPRPAYPTPGAFPAPFPAPAPVPASSNPFDGIDDPGPRPVTASPTAGPDTATEELDDQPRRRRRKRGEEEPPKPEEKPQRSTRTRLAAAPAAGAAGGGSNLVLYIVIGYAVLATLLAIYGLFLRTCERLDPGHPLSTLPDSFGEFSPSKKKEVVPYSFAKTWLDADLPEQQRTKVKEGNKIAVGQLEIEAVKVELRKLNIETKFKTGNTEPNTSSPALVLTLNIKNTSDKPIYPMDPAFTRKANKGSQNEPLTRLVVNKKDQGWFVGGGNDWPLAPNGQVLKKYEKEQEHDWDPLKPGETRQYVVFTDPNQTTRLVEAVKVAKEPLLWRVQVRRAPVTLRGKEVPVTAVIGVEFKQSDIVGWES